MPKLKFDCNDMEEHFEPAVDGELRGDEKRAYDTHLRGCDPCQVQDEQARRIAVELPLMLTDTEEVEARALAAARQAINQINTDKQETAFAAKKVKKKRTLFLLAAWAGAAVIMWRAVAMVSSGGNLLIERAAGGNPALLADTAARFSMTPMYFMGFLLGMVALTAGAFFALSRVWSQE